MAEARVWCTHPFGQLSDHEGQFGEDGGEEGGRPDIGTEVVVAPAEVLDEGMPGNDDPGGAISLQPAHGPEPCLEAPVVVLERIVGMDLRAIEGLRQQLIEDARVDPVPVGRDLDG